jgi:hypothetical protein
LAANRLGISLSISDELERCVGPGGYILDGASAELAETRALQRDNKQDLNALMNKMARALFQQGGAERVEVCFRPLLN